MPVRSFALLFGLAGILYWDASATAQSPVLPPPPEPLPEVVPQVVPRIESPPPVPPQALLERVTPPLGVAPPRLSPPQNSAMPQVSPGVHGVTPRSGIVTAQPMIPPATPHGAVLQPQPYQPHGYVYDPPAGYHPHGLDDSPGYYQPNGYYHARSAMPLGAAPELAPRHPRFYAEVIGAPPTDLFHVRYPYYSYRRPWYTPGPGSVNVTIIW
jgi:hypothetical protein